MLIPISSEYFPIKAVIRAGWLAKKLGGLDVTLLYILEERAFKQIDRVSGYALTMQQRENMENALKDTVDEHSKIVLEHAEKMLSNPNVTITKNIVIGVHTRVIREHVERKGIDLVILQLVAGNLIKYRILEKGKTNVPIWMEHGVEPIKRVMCMCSNLAPNKNTPKYAHDLAKSFDAELHMTYVVDCPKEEESKTCDDGQQFLRDIKQHMDYPEINVHLMTGDFTKTSLKAIQTFNPDLVVVGRVEKQIAFHDFFDKSVRVLVAKKSQKSVLLV